ncbi:MAG: DUF4388 domain-containing protein, partial [Nannocystaceae bacterium]|nr:DUF4388 domain-containing protein [Nannocystaceae bacterium]
MSQDRAAFAGELADLHVADLLQTIVDGSHSGTVRLDTELGGATIWFRDGHLVDADMGRFHMEAAIRRLMPLTNGSFEVEFKPINRKRVIETESRDLLIEARARAPKTTEEGAETRSRVRRSVAHWSPTGGGSAKRLKTGSAKTPRGPGGGPQEAPATTPG